MNLPENHPARLFSLEQVLEATERFDKKNAAINPHFFLGAMLISEGNLFFILGWCRRGDKSIQLLDNIVDGEWSYCTTEDFIDYRPATESEIRAVFEQQETQS